MSRLRPESNSVLYNSTIDALSQHCIKDAEVSMVIVMMVLYNSEHSLSISDIVMCVSKSLGGGGGCSGDSACLH